MTLTLVVATGANGVIGADGGLPWRLPEDQAHFKALTMGSVLLMGRATYDSIGRPLPGRRPVRLARGLGAQVFVVGGAQVYAGTLALADRLVITHVEQSPAGDTYLPDVDWTQWREVERLPYDGFSIVTYDRVR